MDQWVQSQHSDTCYMLYTLYVQCSEAVDISYTIRPLMFLCYLRALDIHQCEIVK